MKIFEEYKNMQIYNEFPELRRGFTSTSLNKDIAISFMLKELSEDDVPVLYQIQNLSEDGYSYFKLDNEDYSSFPHEQEVLLITDKFRIIEISEKEHEGRKY